MKCQPFLSAWISRLRLHYGVNYCPLLAGRHREIERFNSSTARIVPLRVPDLVDGQSRKDYLYVFAAGPLFVLSIPIRPCPFFHSPIKALALERRLFSTLGVQGACFGPIFCPVKWYTSWDPA